jgi:hypothetical protein
MMVDLTIYNPESRQFVEESTEEFAFIDSNSDGKWNPTHEIITSWTDINGNGTLDFLADESFTDTNKNGVWDIGEPFEDRNRKYDAEEPFVDTNDNGIYDEAELFTDTNLNSIYDAPVFGDDPSTIEVLETDFEIMPGEPFVDTNGNGIYDEAEEFTDLVGDGKWTQGDTALPTNTSTRNLGEGESIQTWVPMDEPYDDINNNGIYDDSDYASGGLMVRATNPNIWGFSPAGGTLVPDFIDSREDIRNLFRGIDYSNTGTGFGPDSYSKKRFDYILADFDHSFTDNLSMKVSVAYEDLFDKQLSSGWSANQINFSSGYGVTVRFPTLRSINTFYEDENNQNQVSPFESVLVDLTNANYAHLALENIDNNGLEAVRSDMKAAMNTWATTEWSGSFSSLTSEAITNVDQDDDGVASNDEMVDYWVDNYLDLSEADTELEKLYELAKFSGRVQNFLKESHSNYNQSNGYSYLWGFSGMGDPIYDALTGSDLGAPQSNASTQIFELDRYVNVPKYREQIRDWDLADSTFNDDNYESIDQKYEDHGTLKNLIKIGSPTEEDKSKNGYEQFVYTDNFSLDEDGERLIYDSIPNWLITGTQGEREMRALPKVELYDEKTYAIDQASGGYDGQLNVNNDTEVDLQRRAIAKRIYDYLVDEVNDPSSDSEFWDGTKKIYDFFKYELHNNNDYGWMWEQHIQPGLLSKARCNRLKILSI